MSLIEKIKNAQLEARRNRNVSVAATLTTLISEIEMIGKNNQRDATDQEAVSVIQKFIKNIDLTLEVLIPGPLRDSYITEKELLMQFQPTQMSEHELSNVISSMIKTLQNPSSKDIGKIMSFLKTDYGSSYDGKLASQLVKTMLSQETQNAN